MKFARSIQGLFVFAIALSAFLIFLVQPMVGKRLLPWYGGAPGVWTVCLAFYQMTLFVGYAYAHGLMRLARPRLEFSIHTLVFACALLVLPVLPDDTARQQTGADATGEILLALLTNVALPFLFLAATGPMIQSWYSRLYPPQSPYFLYAYSNAGSLLALLLYPFIVEPNFGLAESGEFWNIGFTLVGISILVCGFCAMLNRRGESQPNATCESDNSNRVGVGQICLWMSLSGVAVVLLMGITNQLCLDIASVPFLWILPLAIYLLTFILCFSAPRFYRRWPFVIVALVAMLLMPYTDSAFNTGGGVFAWLQSRPVAIAVYGLLLFASCMVAHGELYRRRPPPRSLTLYYLSVSAGGAIGGLLVGIVATRLLNDFYEVPLGIALWIALVLGLAIRDTKGPLHTGSSPWRKVAACVLGAAVVVLMLTGERYRWADVVYQQRSFFGVLRVVESEQGEYPIHLLRHGTTLHGYQFRNQGQSSLPTTYYGYATGIGLAMQGLAARDSLRVGIVGLGAGTLSAYGRPEDFYRYYEIDPEMITLARNPNLFTYIRDSRAETEIVEADGRLGLESERERAEDGWDILVLDAFSSDAVPVHLLTREAFELYESRLVADGILAIHVSNRHLDLAEVCFRLAESAGLDAVMVKTAHAPRFGSVPARWVFAMHDAAKLEDLKLGIRNAGRSLRLSKAHLRVDVPKQDERATLWTDDYSDLLGVLRRR